MNKAPHCIVGLVAATPTPMRAGGEIDPRKIPSLVETYVTSGIAALYACGTTGEGASLSEAERREVGEAFVKASAGRLPVILQVGCDSLGTAKSLAAHAEAIGADFLSAIPPTYFPIDSAEALVQHMAEIAAAAPGLPFYYYHIPRMSGVKIDMVRFLELGRQSIPTLRGIKFSDFNMAHFSECQNFDEGRFDILWGSDEMLLGALAMGAKGAVGSTYNFAAPLYHRVIRAFEDGDLEEARLWMRRAIEVVRTVKAGTPQFLPTLKKAAMGLVGLELGPCRTPLPDLDDAAAREIRRELEELGFLQWI